MSDHAVPILLNHDHTKQIGVFEAGIVTFLPDHRPTKEEFFSIFGNAGFRVMEQFIDRDGTVRISTAEIHEFSFSAVPAVDDRIKRLENQNAALRISINRIAKFVAKEQQAVYDAAANDTASDPNSEGR